jgi:methyl-accepting chemotaxis protein
MIKNLGLSKKVLIPILVIFPLVTLITSLYVSRSLERNTVETAEDSAKSTIEQYKLLRAYYTKEVAGKVKAKDAMKVDWQHDDADTIPLPATMIHDLSKALESSGSGIRLSLYSDKPFPNRASRRLDQFQQDALAHFKQNPDGTYSKVFMDKGSEHVRVGVADKLVAESCVKCHNSRPDSPFKEWKIGDVRGVLEVQVPIKKQVEANSSLIFGIISFFSGSTAFAVAALAFMLIYMVVKPITALMARLTGSVNVSEAATGTMRDSSTSISTASTQQAAAVQETVSAVAEISAMLAKSSENAESSTKQAEKSHQVAHNGKAIVAEAVDAMGGIKSSNERIFSEIEKNSRKFEEVAAIIAEIAGKTKVINDIVFQTKLLSFNASVEAARAGEHGKGFAVVAEEVGNLATMSGNAAKEIDEMLKGSVEKVNSIVQMTNQSLESLTKQGTLKVDEGIEITKRCGSVLDEVVANADIVKNLMTQLSAGFAEQSQGVSNISKAMNEIDSTTQENSLAAQEISNLAEKVSAHSAELKEIIANLERQVVGSKALPPPNVVHLPAPKHKAAKKSA